MGLDLSIQYLYTWYMETWQLDILDKVPPSFWVDLENREAVEQANSVNEEQDFE